MVSGAVMSAASPISLASAGDDVVCAPAVPSAFERRAHMRRRLDELPWVTGVRLRYGPPVSLIDLSPGGAQIDTASYRLQPGANLVVEIAGADRRLTVRSKVVRCQVSAIAPQTFYRGAVAFDWPLDLPDLSLPLASSDVVAPRTADARQSFGEWKRIVARFEDGRLLRGFCRDFLPIGGAIDVWALPDAPQQARITVPVRHLKAVIFQSAGEPGRIGDTRLEQPGSRARRAAVTFLDDEVIEGMVLDYQPDGVGFYLVPLDTARDDVRFFVFLRAIREVRLLPE